MFLLQELTEPFGDVQQAKWLFEKSHSTAFKHSCLLVVMRRTEDNWNRGGGGIVLKLGQ